MILNQFERTKLVRKNWRIVSAYHARQFSYRAMAAIFQVNIPTIYKILNEHNLIRKSVIVPVIAEESGIRSLRMRPILNQQYRAAYARENSKKITRMYRDGQTIRKIASKFETSPSTIYVILDAHRCARDHRTNKMHVSNKELEERIALCRLPDDIKHMCNSCGRTYNYNPDQCNCGSTGFTKTQISHRLDLSRLPDDTTVKPVSLTARKISASRIEKTKPKCSRLEYMELVGTNGG